MEAEGRLVIQTGGRCRYGRVRVRYLRTPADEPAAPRAEAAPEVAASKDWNPEEVAAAMAGAALGLESAGAAGRCVVTALHDPSHPPSVIRPWTVAVAAVRAAWAAVGFVPDEETARRVEAQAAQRVGPSWSAAGRAEPRAAADPAS
jgi:hypothetical protein